jgi:hypothetical protein
MAAGVTRRVADSASVKVGQSYHGRVADDLDRISPRESAHAKARDRKTRPPKVVSVNPGLKKLAQHIADKSRGTRRKKNG